MPKRVKPTVGAILPCWVGSSRPPRKPNCPAISTAPPSLPRLLRPAKGRYGLTDYEKAFVPDPRDDIYARRGIDRAHGCMVVVRPDQFVAEVLPLDDRVELSRFFERFMCVA